MNKTTGFWRSRANSFKNASEGWLHVIRTQRNAWIHATISLLVIIAAILLRVSLEKWLVLILTIAIVWMAEFFNTALENIVDLASPQVHPLAKTGKDIAAGAVLLVSVAALIIGVLIFGPPLWNIFFK